MSQVVQIQWTCANIDEARRIASSLVQEKLVACANLVPHIESIYIWQGKLETSQEVKVFFKAPRDNFEKVRDYIKKHCSYDVPEISMISFEEGNPTYFNWVFETTR